MISCDVAIIGAGPAGLCAARPLLAAGLKVTLIDEQPEAGGQIYRSVGRATHKQRRILGPEYGAGRSLLDVLTHRNLHHITGASVFEVNASPCIWFSCNGQADRVDAAHVILATGAQERPFPFPGWQLPGVMSVGAGQILLKSSGVLPKTPTVLAGSGPLLLALVAQYVRAGHPIRALVDTTPRSNRRRAASSLPAALMNSRYIQRGAALLMHLRRHNVPVISNASQLTAHGSDRIERVSFVRKGERHEYSCAALLVHNGIIPNVQITRSLDLEHTWDDVQRYWYPHTDEFGRAAPNITLAGDCTRILGADAAEHSGVAAGFTALHSLNRITAGEWQTETAGVMKKLEREKRARRFLDQLYRPDADEFASLDESTIICRCEEVTAGAIREFVDLGCLGPNQTKAYSRCGMGPCQGRMCATSVAGIIAAHRNVNPESVGSYRIRSPIKPVTLGELATLADDASPASGNGR